MPIKRKFAKQFEVWDIIVSLARDAVRELRQPLTSNGWKHLISRELEIDIETSIRIFEELVENGVLSFVRTRGKKAIYINDRTPEFKKYMWSGDLHYE